MWGSPLMAMNVFGKRVVRNYESAVSEHAGGGVSPYASGMSQSERAATLIPPCSFSLPSGKSGDDGGTKRAVLSELLSGFPLNADAQGTPGVGSSYSVATYVVRARQRQHRVRCGRRGRRPDPSIGRRGDVGGLERVARRRVARRRHARQPQPTGERDLVTRRN